MFIKKLRDYTKPDLAVGMILDRIYTKEQLERIIWNKAKEIMPYLSCCVERGKYVFFFDNCDAAISNNMFHTKKIYEGKELELFFRLVKKYYGYTPNDKETVFLDIGGNIGTMSIAAKTKWDSLKVIGFEPARENVKLFKINAIVNDKDIQVYNMALSNFDGTADLFLNKSSCVEHILMMDQYRDASRRECVEQVDVMRLDSWCEKYGLPMNEVGYICLDVEGHENAVLEGGEKLLSDHAIPVWLEVSSEQYRNGSVDSLIHNISKYYNFYIDKREPHIVNKIYKLRGLLNEFVNSNSHTDIFLIK